MKHFFLPYISSIDGQTQDIDVESSFPFSQSDYSLDAFFLFSFPSFPFFLSFLFPPHIFFLLSLYFFLFLLRVFTSHLHWTAFGTFCTWPFRLGLWRQRPSGLLGFSWSLKLLFFLSFSIFCSIFPLSTCDVFLLPRSWSFSSDQTVRTIRKKMKEGRK